MVITIDVIRRNPATTVKNCDACSSLASQVRNATSAATGRSRSGSKPSFVSGDTFRANWDYMFPDSGPKPKYVN